MTTEEVEFSEMWTPEMAARAEAYRVRRLAAIIVHARTLKPRDYTWTDLWRQGAVTTCAMTCARLCPQSVGLCFEHHTKVVAEQPKPQARQCSLWEMA